MKAIKSAILGAAFLLPVVAFGATISNPLFSNGQTSIDASGGSTVSGTFTLTVGPGEVVEWFHFQADTMPFTPVSVGGNLGLQEGIHTVPFSAKVAPNTGTYNVNGQGAGTWGGNRSISGNDNVVVGPTSLGTVRVVANAPSSPSTDPVLGGGSWIDELIAKLILALKPSKPAYCTGLSAYAGLSYGQTGSQVQALQGFLISNGHSIPAGATSFYGNQTLAAHTAAKAACN